MNQIDFYKHYVKPHLKSDDRPFNRQLYNDAKDMLHKEGKITNWQVQNWVYPVTKAFMSPNEKRLHLTYKGYKRK